MYKAKLWDEDKLDIRSGSYSSLKYENIFSNDKQEDIKYHEQKYDSKEGNISSDYMRKQEEDDETKMHSENSSFLSEEDGERKEQEIKEDEIPFKAAKQLFNETRNETKTTEKKSDTKTIEDAIKKASEEESNIIVMES